MRSNEFVRGLRDFVVTLRLSVGTSKVTVSTMLVAQSHLQAQLLVLSLFGKGALQSIKQLPS
jgi:hypothetical protein